MKRSRLNKSHQVTSDYSGFVFPRSEMRYTWDGYLVHSSEWEPKQPQLDIRSIQEDISVEGVRVRQEDPALLNPPMTTAQMI